MDGHNEVQTRHDRRKSDDENAQAGGLNVSGRIERAERRIEGPPGINSPASDGIQRQECAHQKYIETAEVQFRECDILCPDHDWYEEVA